MGSALRPARNRRRGYAANCLALLEVINAMGYLNHFDWGCKDGVHSGWAIIEAENRDQAHLAVPFLVRAQARVVRLNKFGDEALRGLHKR